MKTLHIHLGRTLGAHWALAIWAPMILVVALALPDRAWAPGVATFLDVALLALTAALALAGRPVDDRLWRGIAGPLPMSLGRLLAHLLLLAPSAWVLDHGLVVELEFLPGVYAAALLCGYGALCAARSLGRLWSVVALLAVATVLAADLWFQVQAGTWSGTPDLRRALVTLGLGGIGLGLLWELRLGAWGLSVKAGRAPILLVPALFVAVAPPVVDRALGPVIFYSAGLGQLSADGHRALRVVVSDGYLVQGPTYALLWQDGVERRVGPDGLTWAYLGPGETLLFETQEGDRTVLRTEGGTPLACSFDHDHYPTSVTWRDDAGAMIVRTTPGNRAWLAEAGRCVDLGADDAVFLGSQLATISGAALQLGDRSVALPATGLVPVPIGERLYLLDPAIDGLRAHYRLDADGLRAIGRAANLRFLSSETLSCSRAGEGAWVCGDGEGLLSTRETPPSLWFRDGVATGDDGATWTIPAELLARIRKPPMVRLDARTLRVLDFDALWDLDLDGSVRRTPLLGARPAD